MHLHFFLLILLFVAHPPLSSSSSSALPGCEEKCGNITIPYPFGLSNGCYRDNFKVHCNTSTTPPTPFIDNSPYMNLEISKISLASGEITVNTKLAKHCNKTMGMGLSTIKLEDLPYYLSVTRNKFTVVGCEAMGFYMNNTISNETMSGCMMSCNKMSHFTNGTCSGIGCCNTAIPSDIKTLGMVVGSQKDNSDPLGVGPCSYAFLVDEQNYRFSTVDLWGLKMRDSVPTVLDWAIGKENCSVVSKSIGKSYSCRNNTICIDSNNGPGYRCACRDGYHGNPYLPTGCQDINECDDPSSNSCSDICTNIPGSYTCSCAASFYGDGQKKGKGCIKENKSSRFQYLQTILGVGFSIFFVIVCASLAFWLVKKRRKIAQKERFFEQNGGLLLKQQISSQNDAAQIIRIFREEELVKATDNYNKSNILGEGGQGLVYKGVLPDKRIVAIKKSKLVDKTQLEQFINEVLILSQTLHGNIVRIIGCCLETEVPLLVYEFISNGTLQEHIHDHSRAASFSLSARLRIAAQTATAIDYLHTAISMPIVHRDIKTANILLDNKFNAKVSDFGLSKLVALEEQQVTTLVQGTLGYLDPEYLQSGLLTEKSDVYSFGVVLVELLTAMKPVSLARPEEERNLAQHFLVAMKKGCLVEILDPKMVEEDAPEQLMKVAEEARKCLSVKSEERPTMKNVAAELAKLISKDQNRHPWVYEEHEDEEANLVAMSESTETGSVSRPFSRSENRIILQR